MKRSPDRSDYFYKAAHDDTLWAPAAAPTAKPPTQRSWQQPSASRHTRLKLDAYASPRPSPGSRGGGVLSEGTCAHA